MIKANELRIGNYITLNGERNVITGIFHQLSDMDKAGQSDYNTGIKNERFDIFIQDKRDLDYRIELLQPIPLSPEILESCGFVQCYKSSYTLRYDYDKNTKFGAGWNLVNNHFSVRYIGEQFTHIKHLHQLQNLYFALTGEELKIKELELVK